MTKRVSEFAWTIGTGLVSLSLGLISIGFRFEKLESYWGTYDLTFAYGFAKSILHSAGSQFNPYLGLATGTDLSHFPVTNIWWILVLKMGGFIGLGPIGAVNLSILLSFPLVAATMFLTLRFFSVARTVSVVLALSFSLIPWHFDRIAHPSLAFYWIVPIGIVWMAFLSRVPRARVAQFSTKFRIGLGVVLGVVIGLGDSYYVIMLSILAFTGIAFRWRCLKKDWEWLRSLIVAFVPAATLGTTLVWIRINETVPSLFPITTRTLEEQQYYGGSTLALLADSSGSSISIPFFSEALSNAIASGAGPGERVTVNLAMALAGITALGFVLFSLLSGSKIKRRFEAVSTLSGLWLVSVLFTVTSGLGLAFGALVTAQIRVWGRMGIISVGLAAVILGILLTKFVRGSSLTNPGRFKLFGLWSVLAVLLLNAATISRPIAANKETPEELKGMMSVAESALGRNCQFLNFPPSSFPEGPDIVGMSTYDSLLPYVASESASFSYGATWGQVGATWQQRLSNEPAFVVDQAKAAGFCGIVVDAFGFDQPDVVLDGFTQSLGAPISSAVDRWFVFNVAAGKPFDPEAPLFTDPELRWTPGTSKLEFTEDFTPVYRTQLGETTFFVTNPDSSKRKFNVNLELWAENCSVSSSIDTGQKETVNVELNRGDRETISFPLELESMGFQEIILSQQSAQCGTPAEKTGGGLTFVRPSIEILSDSVND